MPILNSAREVKLDPARLDKAETAYWLGDGGHTGCLEAAILAYLQSGPERAAEEMLAGPVAEIAAERRRQVEGEGWTAEHDDKHKYSELANAAACYAMAPRPWNLPTKILPPEDVAEIVNRVWPWWSEYDDGGRGYSRWKAWWKPKDRRRDLIRAGALIVAEIERLDRAAAKPPVQP